MALKCGDCSGCCSYSENSVLNGSLTSGWFCVRYWLLIFLSMGIYSITGCR